MQLLEDAASRDFHLELNQLQKFSKRWCHKEEIGDAIAIVDDILTWGRDIQEHDARLKIVLDHE